MLNAKLEAEMRDSYHKYQLARCEITFQTSRANKKLAFQYSQTKAHLWKMSFQNTH